jgi:hypothetical protein
MSTGQHSESEEQGPEMGRKGTFEEGSMRDFEDAPSGDETLGGNEERGGIGVGAGMGGFMSYNADGPISTTLDDVGDVDTGNTGGEPGNINSGSTGGRGVGQTE